MKQSFETPGGELTAREIAQQPDVWLDIAALVDRERTRLEAFLAPALANPRIRVVLTGAGTSSYIGACLAPALANRTYGANDPLGANIRKLQKRVETAPRRAPEGPSGRERPARRKTAREGSPTQKFMLCSRSRK